MVVVGALMVSASLAQPAWDLSTFPVAPVAWMSQQGIQPASVRMASSDTTGNYLELLDGTQAHAFIDDRVDMYPASVVDDYLVLEHGLARLAAGPRPRRRRPGAVGPVVTAHRAA